MKPNTWIWAGSNAIGIAQSPRLVARANLTTTGTWVCAELGAVAIPMSAIFTEPCR